MAPKLCDLCRDPAELRCPNCKTTRYCGTLCQKLTWSCHRFVCGTDPVFLRQPDLHRDEVRVLLKTAEEDRSRMTGTRKEMIFEHNIDQYLESLDKHILTLTPKQRNLCISDYRSRVDIDMIPLEDKSVNYIIPFRFAAILEIFLHTFQISEEVSRPLVYDHFLVQCLLWRPEGAYDPIRIKSLPILFAQSERFQDSLRILSTSKFQKSSIVFMVFLNISNQHFCSSLGGVGAVLPGYEWISQEDQKTALNTVVFKETNFFNMEDAENDEGKKR